MGSKRTFQTKHGIAKRLFSFILVFAMVITSFIPGGIVAKADTGTKTNIRIHFMIPNTWGWSQPAIQFWDGSDVTVSEDAKDGTGTDIPGWGGAQAYMLTKGQVGTSTTDYSLVVKGTIAGIQFLDFGNTSNTVNNAYDAKLTQYTGDTPTDVYYIQTDGKWVYYLDADGKNSLPDLPKTDPTFLLVGNLPGIAWNQNAEPNLVKDGDTYSITLKNVPAADSYDYKILQDSKVQGWNMPWGSTDNRTVKVDAPADITFTIDINDEQKDVKVVQKKIETLVVENGNIVKGKAAELNTAAKYYDGSSANAADVTVSYALKSASEDVTLTGNTITVAKNSKLTAVTVTAAYNGFSQDITIPVVSKEYQVTINMYSQDLEMTPGVSDIYIFENGGGENTVLSLTGTVDDPENGVTWVTGTTTVPYNSLGIIARDTAGTWDGGQDGNQYYVIDENATEITLWYEYGKTPTTEKPTITKTEQRYFYLEYENSTLGDDVVPQFYSWTTGYAAKLIDFEKQDDGTYRVIVPVKANCTKVDYVIALDATSDPWTKDGGDHSVSFPLDQTVVCASMKEGEEPQLSAPYNVGYELQPKEDRISFYYRDDSALVDETLADLKVSVDVNGTEHAMVYSAENKRFEYVQMGLKEGRTDYRYHVTKSEDKDEYVLDKFNENAESIEGTDYSYVDYYKLDADITAEVMNPSFNYNENNVVKFTVNQNGDDSQKLEVASASIDVSSLGGSSALAIEPELQAVTISATTDTALGKKTLPIVVTDQYGNEYTTSVDVEVVARTKTDANDFDWDEAVIYFMVTDRFFDGNSSNNTASGTQTYGDNEGLYHGGDFAGVTAKLDYLEELGINTIWITPIVENIPGVDVTGEGSDDVPYNAAFHGYWASDFTKLNPTLGTEAEFETLISEAHSRGIRIMVDIVVNHAGYDTEFGDMIRSGEDIVSGDDQKDSLSNLPDFRTEDPDVRAQLVKWQTAWVENYDIDYFRVDTVKHVEGTTWAALKNSVTEADPSFKMIGEYAGGGYAGNGGTLGTGQMDSDLDFDFNDQATSFVSGNLSSVESFLSSRNAALNNTYLTGQFLGSHDEIGFKQNLIDNKGMTEEAATAASMVAASLQITAKGQPVIYYGEEIGLTGENNYPYQTNRYDFDWTLANENNATYQHYKKMLAIRNEYSELFARGDRKSVLASDADGYDVFSRSYKGTTLYVGLNIKDTAATVSIPVSENAGSVLTDLYSDNTYTVESDGTVKVTIPAAADGGTVILKTTKSASGGGSTGGSSASGDTAGTTKTETLSDGTVVTTVTKTDAAGNVTETVTKEKTDGTKTEEVTVTSADGSVVKTTTNTDSKGDVTSVTSKSAFTPAADTTATVTIKKDGAGTVTSAKSTLVVKENAASKAILSGDVVSQLTQAAGQTDLPITVTVVKSDSTATAYKVSVNANDLKSGNKLYIYVYNSKTGQYTMVDSKTYKVGKDGSLTVSMKSNKNYVLVDAAKAKKINKNILSTIKPKKSSVTLKKGKKTTFALSSKANTENIKKITYTTSNKSVATVSKKGKITAKKAGTVTIKAKVTLKNGSTKTIKMKVKVKK